MRKLFHIHVPKGLTHESGVRVLGFGILSEKSFVQDGFYPQKRYPRSYKVKSPTN